MFVRRWLKGGRYSPVEAPTGSPASGGATGALTGKWQAMKWAGAISRINGSSTAHRSWAFGQRVRKRQPDGGLMGEGRSPARRWLVEVCLTSGSGTGID